MASSNAELPFKQTRLRGHAAKLDRIIDPHVTICSSVALAMHNEASSSSPSQQVPGQVCSQSLPPEALQEALQEISSLRSQLAGVAAAVTLLDVATNSGRNCPTHGRRAPHSPKQTTPLPSNVGKLSSNLQAVARNQLPVSAEKLSTNPNSLNAAQVAGACSSRSMRSGVAGDIGAIGPAAWLQGSTARSPKSMSNTGAAQVQGMLGSIMSAGAVADYSKGTYSADAMAEDEMQAAVQDPINHLMRQSAQILARHGHGAAAAAKQQWQKSSSSAGTHPVVPVSRDEAIQLEQRLLESLPAGAMMAMQQQHATQWLQQQQQQCKQQLSVQPHVLQLYQQLMQQRHHMPSQPGHTADSVLSTQLLEQHQLLDELFSEAAAQVAFHCVEQGRVLDNIRERYAESANSLYLGIYSLQQHNAACAGALNLAVAAATSNQQQVQVQQKQLADRQAEFEDVKANLTSYQARYEQLQQESQEQQGQLQQRQQALQQQLGQARDDAEAQQLAAEQAAAVALAEADAKLAAAEETNADLLQRLKLAMAQLAGLRVQIKPKPVASHVAVQTDEVPQQIIICEAAAQQVAAKAADGSEFSEEEDEEQAPKHHKKGIDLLRYAKRGHMRTKLWVIKVIGQVYADKALADAVADRQGQPRATLPPFLLTWHSNRYGLPKLAKEALRDLLASTCQHGATGCRPVLWFAHFCGIAKCVGNISSRQSASSGGQQQQQKRAPSGAVEQHHLDTQPAEDSIADASFPAELPVGIDLKMLLASPAALDFYLFCCCQLAYPNSIVALFPEGEDALPLVRSNLVMESLRAIFRYLQDPDGQAVFAARHLEAAAVWPSSTAAAAATANVMISPKAATHSARGIPRDILFQDRFGNRSNSPEPLLQQQQQQQQQHRLQPSSHRSCVMKLVAADDPVLAATAAARGSSWGGGGAVATLGGITGSGARPSSVASSSTGSGFVSLVGGFGYYSAWGLLDMLMEEWVDRAVASAKHMSELRSAIGAMQPPLHTQLANAATAAASKPAQLARLQEAAIALHNQLTVKAPVVTAIGGSDSDSGSESEACDGDSSSTAVADFRTLCQHDWHMVHVSAAHLVLDAVAADAGAAWRAYEVLLAQLQIINDRSRATTPSVGLPASSSMTEPRAAAVSTAAATIAAAAAAAHTSQPGKPTLWSHQGLKDITTVPITMHSGNASGFQLQQPLGAAAAAANDASQCGAAADFSALQKHIAADVHGSGVQPGMALSAAVLRDAMTPGVMEAALQAARARRQAQQQPQLLQDHMQRLAPALPPMQ